MRGRIEMLSQVVIVEAIVSTDDVNKIDGYRAVRQRCWWKINWVTVDSLESTLLFIFSSTPA